MYPDWRHAGISGGIPDVPVKFAASEFGARPDDDRDDSDALQSAVERLAREGGGALLLEAGVHVLDRPVVVTADGIVIRGAGSDRTRLVFRFTGPDGERAVRPEHLGRWSNENLFEQVTIRSREGHGSYGHGLWSAGPEHPFGGGEGPRNIVYHCDITAQHRGVVMNASAPESSPKTPATPSSRSPRPTHPSRR